MAVSPSSVIGHRSFRGSFYALAPADALLAYSGELRNCATTTADGTPCASWRRSTGRTPGSGGRPRKRTKSLFDGRREARPGWP